MSTHEKTTDELINEIKSGKIEKYIEQNEQEFTEVTLHEYICNIIREKELKKSKVVARSGLNRIYIPIRYLRVSVCPPVISCWQ